MDFFQTKEDEIEADEAILKEEFDETKAELNELEEMLKSDDD